MRAPKKVALVHDWLTGQRGGEKVLEVLAELFPEAPVYTLFHLRGSQAPDIENRTIHTSVLQKMPLARTKYRSYLPFYPLAVELFDLQDYDLVISSSHCAAKGIIPRPDALHVSYIHSPMRYAWNAYHTYFSGARLGPLSRWVVPPVVHYLRLWDESSSSRTDVFVANSRNVARRIAKYYRRRAAVIPPPVDTEFFRPGPEKTEDYFLIVSALVPYKRIDRAVALFNRTGRELRVVGSGPDLKRLKKEARPNIRFLGSLAPEDLLRTYRRARAFLQPWEEDFGIAVLEAQACGVPVAAYGRGGAAETVLHGRTGILYDEPTAAGLGEALDNLERLPFNKTAARNNAMRFSRKIFKNRMSRFISRAWAEKAGST
ncbi:MAG: glycosyltransferase family 4 protein [Candidatus Aminicenantes bacterium]|nr:glycosyltransferase family 4 protein [Candidatus Aminicenantes bacterium]